MIAALHIVLFGAITFVAQDLADLSVDAGSPEPGFTYRLADLDGNGQQDLILPAGVYFQHNAAFSDLMKAPSPATDAPAACDLWNDTLYLRLHGRLQKVRWEGKAWNIQTDQPISWPDPGNQTMMSMHAAPAGLRFDRFLHDVDRDGAPEIIVPNERGLSIFRTGPDGSYQKAAELDVFPPVRLARIEDRRLWPESERRIFFPARTMNCRYNVNANEIAVIAREDARYPAMTIATTARYRAMHFTLDTDAFQIVAAETREELTEPFPPHLQLVRLNDDGLIDIAGGDWRVVPSSPLPMPIYETTASTDGGKTFKTARVTGFRPHQSFIDVNHDGKTDMVTESTGLFDGGVRESLSRFCTSKEVRHEVRVYLQDASGRFAQKPGISGVFYIELESAPIRGGIMFSRYQAGELFNLTGDFDRDGGNDAVVQDRPGRLALYPDEAGGFASRPCASIAIDNLDRFSVADYNGDGRADIAVHWYNAGETATRMKTKLYLTREGAE
jgi:hypothetical protein